MPKVARVRSAHIPSAKATTKDQDDALPSLDVLMSSSSELAAESSSNVPQVPNQQTKKAKLQEKRQAFLQKLEPSARQVSKSTARRMKRKAREQLTGGLDDLQQAIATLEEEATLEEASMQTIAGGNSAEQPAQSSKSSTKKGLIGKGGSAPLSKNQRKRALELERMRHPLILSNPEYSSNPFQTIRTHAQNSLLKQGGAST